MREPRMGSRFVLRALTALALVIAPFHFSIDGPVAAKAHAGKGGNGNGGNGNGNGGGSSGGNGNGNSGGNNGNGNSGNSNSGGKGKGNSASKASTVDHVNTLTGDKVEVNGKSIKVTHPNGMKEEIENGRFRMEDALGRTIVDRAATAADMARLKSL